MQKIILVLALSFISLFALAKIQNPYPAVCDFVNERIYLDSKLLKTWYQICKNRESLVKDDSPADLVIKDMNNVFDLLKVSHLKVYPGQKVKQIWQGDSFETGLQGRFVEGQFVVWSVAAGSAAELAHIRPFDIIIKINSEHPSEARVKTEFGHYEILRSGKILHKRLSSKKYSDLTPLRIVKSKSRTTYTNILVPSFSNKDYSADLVQREFDKHKKSLQDFVIDLRGNSGGNFRNGLHFLEQFICKKTRIGTLVRPKFLNQSESIFPNTFADDEQIKVIRSSSKVHLETLSVAGKVQNPKKQYDRDQNNCMPLPKAVLIDADTASVAEIVALAFQEKLNVPIWGATSAGQVLVGMWYPWMGLEKGVQIVIPEAIYESSRGQTLEGVGIQPDQVLYYKIEDINQKSDSWLLRKK